MLTVNEIFGRKVARHPEDTFVDEGVIHTDGDIVVERDRNMITFIGCDASVILAAAKNLLEQKEQTEQIESVILHITGALNLLTSPVKEEGN